MTIRHLRKAALAGCLALLIVAGTSCDVLNPALVGDLGGNPVNAGPQPGGSILVVLSNQRSTIITLNFDYEVVRSGGGVYTSESFINAPAGNWPTALDCDTTTINITGIEGEAAVDTQTGEALELVRTFERPDLQCGSVVFVTVPAIGPATAEIFP